MTTDDRPTLEEQLAAQARLRDAALKRAELESPDNTDAKTAMGCLVALVAVLAGLWAVVGLIGGWAYLVSLIF